MEAIVAYLKTLSWCMTGKAKKNVPRYVPDIRMQR